MLSIFWNKWKTLPPSFQYLVVNMDDLINSMFILHVYEVLCVWQAYISRNGDIFIYPQGRSRVTNHRIQNAFYVCFY